MTRPVVTIGEDAIAQACHEGVALLLKSLRLQDHSAPRNLGDELLHKVSGIGAELAVADHLRLSWRSQIGAGFGRPDLPYGIEVKGRRSAGSDIGLQPTITRWNLAPIYVLVWGTLPEYQIVGWISGDTIRDHWDQMKVSNWGCHWVPWQALEPIETIPIPTAADR